MNCVDLFTLPKGNKLSWREKEQMQTLIVTFSFPVLVLARACLPGPPSQLRVWAPTKLFFLFSIPRPLSSNKSEPAADFSWYISIFNLGARNYDPYFGNPPFSFLYISSFSYMFLSFPPSRSRPVNLTRKQLSINQSP